MTFPATVHIATRTAIATAVAEFVATCAHRVVRERGVFTIALPGGSVADACVPTLAHVDLPWGATHVFWCDERAVPAVHPDSNAGQARRLWHGSPLAQMAAIHAMPAHEANLDHAATQYAALLTEIAGSEPMLDVVLLGVGEDGHVASLFPEHPQLVDTHWVLVERHSPKPPSQRLTLSLNTLAAARHVVIVAFGAEKASVLREALTNAESRLPVARVIQQAGDVQLWLDSDAASLLRVA